jgi:hypothetical protein
MHQRVSRGLAVLLLVSGLGMASSESASAGQCRSDSVPTWDPNRGSLVYKVTLVDCAAGQTPGSPASGGNGGPSCDVASATPATFCVGLKPCYYKETVVPYDKPKTPPPTPDAEWRVQMCFGDGPAGLTFYGLQVWVGPASLPPPLIDQAREALGHLKAPSATLAFNPTTRTLVNLDTWFWADGLTPKELRGTPAFGLVAVATPDRLEVTPGDGSATRTCPWVTMKPKVPADQPGPCSYAYWRSSIGGSARGPNGAPAYKASAHAVWKVRFERLGAPVIIAGAPDELTGPEMTAPVVVVEVQTIATGTG